MQGLVHDCWLSFASSALRFSTDVVSLGYIGNRTRRDSCI